MPDIERKMNCVFEPMGLRVRDHALIIVADHLFYLRFRTDIPPHHQFVHPTGH